MFEVLAKKNFIPPTITHHNIESDQSLYFEKEREREKEGKKEARAYQQAPREACAQRHTNEDRVGS